VRPLLLVLLVLSGGGLVASLFVPKVRTVEVVGNRHLETESVRALANVHPGDPFLWVTRRRVHDLATDGCSASRSCGSGPTPSASPWSSAPRR